MLNGDVLAKRLYDLFGPAPIDVAGTQDNALTEGLNKRGIFPNHGLKGGVSFFKLDYGVSPPAIIDDRHSYRYWAFYCNEAASASRDELDAICLGQGLERAPLASVAAPYDTLDKKGPWWAIYQRRGSGGVAETSLLSSLTATSWDLIAAYAHAATYVRPGDRVLLLTEDRDVHRFVTSLTSAVEVTLMEEASFGESMFDTVIDIEQYAVEGLVNVGTRIAPAGALITTRKGAWDETDLRLDSSTWQRTSFPREFSKQSGEIELASLRKPSIVTGVAFRNAADTVGTDDIRGLDFERHYVFPHVIRAIVNMQYRTSDAARLRDECQRVLENAPEASPDTGAALCVLSYASKGSRFAVEDARIARYLTLDSDNPHVIRWQISLAFIQGETHMVAGNLTEAIGSFERCLSYDAEYFHLSILTKQLSACVKAANIHASKGEDQTAARFLHRGTVLARKLCNTSSLDVFGAVEDPRYFYYGEISEVMLQASRCAFAYEQWRRGGIDGLRRGLAVSLHLYNQHERSDRSDAAILQPQPMPIEQAFREHAMKGMSGSNLMKFGATILASKVATKVIKQLGWRPR